MSATTGIEWTDATWNPVTGCTEVSPGCDHCYAKTFAERWRGTPGHYFENGFDVQLRPDKLDLPLRWRKPRRIFVNSMSDLFHADVPDMFIAGVFAVMARAPQHTFQVLTKRHARMRSLLNEHDFAARVIGPDPIDWPLPNVWLGVSAESQQWADIRIPALLDTPAAVRFVSCEPLLGPLELTTDLLYRPTPCPSGCSCSRPEDADGYDCACDGPCCMSLEWNSRKPDLNWVIVGGESGPGARPMHPQWARDIRDQCTAAGVPFLFKQWGEYAPGIRDTGYRKGTVRHGFYSGPVVDGRFTGVYASMSRVGKKAAGRELDGRTWDEMPQVVSA